MKAAIIDAPVLMAVRGHRSSQSGSPEWKGLVEVCAEGRMLFLSLYEETERRLSSRELHCRCHEMVDIAVVALGEPPTGRRPQNGGAGD